MKVKITNILLILAISIFYLSNTFASSNQPKTNLKRVLKNFTNYVKKSKQIWHVPGIAIAIVKNNKIIYAKNFGVQKINGQMVAANTTFQIGSCTKAFTAAIMAKLIEEGKFTWHTKVKKLYPKFKLYDPEATREFEVWDLLAHDSGLPQHTGDPQTYLGYTDDHLIHSLRYIKPANKFRSGFAYQNCMYVVAQKIIEKYSGKSFAWNLQHYIFQPLRMRNSTVGYRIPDKQNPTASSPYVYLRGKIIPIPANWPYFYWVDRYQAPGGISSTATDMAKWIIMQMNNGLFNGKEIIKKKDIRFMHQPHTIITKANGKIAMGYGEGWFHDSATYPNYPLIWHDGGVTGMQSIVAFIPKKRIGIVVLTNLSNITFPESLARRFFDTYLGKEPKDWNQSVRTNYNKSMTEIARTIPKCIPIKRHMLTLSKYTGEYINNVYGKVSLIKSKKEIILTIGPKHIKWYLTPCQNNIFKVYWPHAVPGLEPFIGTIKFSDNSNKMVIWFLNRDGGGMFKKID